jgi:hypothetical protein
MWTKTWNYGQKFRVYLWTFKWTQKCSYNFLENVDKNINYGQKHKIMDKIFKSTYEHLSEPRNVHIIFWKMWTKTWNYGQKNEIVDKNFESTYEHLSEPRNVHIIFWKMWTKTWNYGQTFRVYLWTFNWTQKVYFMFLSTFSRKLYEHLNIFIRIGHVSWHLLNMFLGIFITILLFFISINQNHFKIKKTKLYYFQSQPKSTKP